MRIQRTMMKGLIGVVILVIVFPSGIFAQGQGEEKQFKQEELDQLLAPIALYPDSVLTQVLMASTYPLEVVQADRFAKQNKELKGNALTAALEKQPWDASVKSLVNFPQVLAMMSDKLDWMQSLGDAFLGQQKEVMSTIQKLRAKANESGNLKTTKEQTVIVEKETQTIVIEPANPQVVYVPTYNPVVVYGAWPYPAYPPYPVYPPGYVAGAAWSFAAGVAVGAAWGYAWGHSNWGGGDVDVDVNRNTNINNNINREKYKNEMNKGQGGQGGRGEGGRGQGDGGKWQHDPSHRKGVSYRDQATTKKYDRGGSSQGVQSRESYRGRADQGRQDTARADTRDSAGRPSDRGGPGAGGRGDSAGTMDRSSDRGGPGGGGRDNAVGGMDRGSDTKMQSDRGRSSRESMSSRGSSGSGGGSRGGGGGSRGGGGRGGGGRGR